MLSILEINDQWNSYKIPTVHVDVTIIIRVKQQFLCRFSKPRSNLKYILNIYKSV